MAAARSVELAAVEGAELEAVTGSKLAAAKGSELAAVLSAELEAFPEEQDIEMVQQLRMQADLLQDLAGKSNKK